MGSLLTSLEVALVVLFIATLWLSEVSTWIAAAVAGRRIARRNRRGLAAAREASDDDELFAPEHVEEAVHRIARALIASAAPAQRFTIRWELLRVVNRAGHDEDRVLVRVRLAPRPRRHRFRLGAGHPVLDEQWILGADGDAWSLKGRVGDPRSRPAWRAPLIATPAADTQRLTAESLQELAHLDDPVTFDAGHAADPTAELLDRSLADARYSPMIVEGSVARIVEAWEIAATGDPASLRAVATDPAVDALLCPREDPDGARLVVHDLVLVEAHPYDVDVTTTRVHLTVRGTRFLVARSDGRLLAGAPEVQHTMHLDWLLRQDDAAPVQWILVATNDPFTAHDPPGWSLNAPRTFGDALRQVMRVFTARSRNHTR